jgi:hypothetical protein
MELNITEFVRAANPEDYSNSIARSGYQDIGARTWRAAQSADFNLLDTADKVAAAVSYFAAFGAWDDLDTWTIRDLNALTIQEISAQLGEARDLAPATDSSWTEIDWDAYQHLSERGNISGALFRTDTDEVYFTLSE